MPALIADDWGLSPGINEAILKLAEKDCIYGVSLLVDAPFFEHRLEELLQHTSILIGCHLNLTVHWNSVTGALEPLTLSQIAKRLFQSKIISDELQRQVDLLLAKTQRLDYIDGHHHAHIYPGVFHFTQGLAQKTEAKIRLALDRDHTGSWLLGTYRQLQKESVDFLECRYLIKKHWQSPEKLHEKLFSGSYPLIIHPSVAEHPEPVVKSDRWYRERVQQFEKIWSLVSA